MSDPIRSAMKSAVSQSCEISESSAWLMAQRIIGHLDQAGFKVIGARVPELRESRTMQVEASTYQQILGERNKLQANVARLNAELERYRDLVGEAPADLIEIDEPIG